MKHLSGLIIIIFIRYSHSIILTLQSHPGGLLFTKFGSNQTALLDLAFPVLVYKFFLLTPHFIHFLFFL